MMTGRAQPALAGPIRWAWIAVVALLLAPGLARGGGAQPALIGSVGGTFAVLGWPDGGGASVSLAALWPVGNRLSFGVMVHGDDAGTSVDSLRDEQGRGLPHGKVDQGHRAAFGASWRLDASGPARWGFTPFASATWGYYRIADDVRGDVRERIGSTGFSLAAGARRNLGHDFALGASVRYHRLFNDREGRFVSAGLDAFWR